MPQELPIIGSIIDNPMALALELAKLGKYTVSPNPMVGAVIIRERKLLGYGFHLYKGDQHAEIKAINMASSWWCQDAILYVTLEPCCHFGATPPCVDEVIKAGFREIHIATIDPNPLVAGISIEKLKLAGIEVVLGECQQESEALNEIFFHYMRTKRPMVIAKWAMTMDGKIATANFDSKWITSEIARDNVHLLRNSIDAILVGVNTVIKDNPTLNSRAINISKVRIPWKVVLGSKLDLIPKEHNIFMINPEKTFLIDNGDFAEDYKEFLENIGVKFLKISQQEDGFFDLSELLDELGKLDITSLMIEGGGITLAKFLQAELINKFYCYLSPKFIAGAESLTPFSADIGINIVSEAKKAKFKKVEMIGDDILIEGNFNV